MKNITITILILLLLSFLLGFVWFGTKTIQPLDPSIYSGQWRAINQNKIIISATDEEHDLFNLTLKTHKGKEYKYMGFIDDVSIIPVRVGLEKKADDMNANIRLLGINTLQVKDLTNDYRLYYRVKK